MLWMTLNDVVDDLLQQHHLPVLQLEVVSCPQLGRVCITFSGTPTKTHQGGVCFGVQHNDKSPPAAVCLFWLESRPHGQCH